MSIHVSHIKSCRFEYIAGVVTNDEHTAEYDEPYDNKLPGKRVMSFPGPKTQLDVKLQGIISTGKRSGVIINETSKEKTTGK